LKPDVVSNERQHRLGCLATVMWKPSLTRVVNGQKALHCHGVAGFVRKSFIFEKKSIRVYSGGEDYIQPVPENVRLEMVIRMQTEILGGHPRSICMAGHVPSHSGRKGTKSPDCPSRSACHTCKTRYSSGSALYYFLSSRSQTNPLKEQRSRPHIWHYAEGTSKTG